jgi:hypothetical protein
VWETVLSLLTTILPLQTEPPPHVGAVYVLLAFTMVMINVLVQWDKLPPDDMV